MSLEKRMRICILLYCIGFCVLFTAICVDDSLSNPFLWIGLIFYLLGFWYRYRYIRCPNCGSRMKYIRQLPENCPDCGETLY